MTFVPWVFTGRLLLEEKSRITLLDCEAGKPTAFIKPDSSINLVKITDKHIISARRKEGILFVNENEERFNPLISVELKRFHKIGRHSNDPYITDITLIGSNLMMVFCWLGFVFLRISSGRFLGCFEFGDN